MATALLTLAIIISVLAFLFAFVALYAAVFNWMHAGTADFWEVLGVKESPYGEDRRYR